MILGTPNGEAVAQRRLQTLADALGDRDLEHEVNQAARLLRAELPALPDYAALDADHQAFYDVATGLRAAMNLLAPAILRANEGLAKLKTPEFEYTFTVPSRADREGWAEEVAQAVGHLVRLAQGLEPARPRRPFSMFAAAGVAQARARRRYSLAGVLRLYVPDGWLYYGAFGVFGDDGGLADDGCPADDGRPG